MDIPSLTSYLETYPGDSKWKEWVTDREFRRRDAFARQLPVLKDFLDGERKVLDFKKWMDTESKQYNLWGFGGVSGQMFFNMICNNSPNPESLGPDLREAVSFPRTKPEAISKVAKFVAFIRKENERVAISRKRASVGYVPFFLSYFGNTQGGGQHPIYYPSAVGALDDLGLVDLNELEEPADRYETYYGWMERVQRDFNGSMKTTSSFTEVENFLYWIYKQREEIEGEPPRPEKAESGEEVVGTGHTEIQWILAKMGKLHGYKVHVARNDAGKIWNGEKLGDIGGDELPLPGYADEDRRVIELMDVIWFRGNDITHLFEVESSTTIFSALLRMSDLLSLQPHPRPALTIVAPNERKAEARRIMERPTFRRLREEGGGRKFEFKSFEDVRAQYELEMRGAIIR